MPSEFDWASPGGTYRVPADWKRRFLAEFPDYRVRWSIRKGMWQVEQSFGRGALPPVRIDDGAHDDLIRARDGYWLVMEFLPGDRFACPAVLSQYPRTVCGWTLRAPTRKRAEVKCPACRKAGRDGRTVAGFYPFDEALLDDLRRTNPLTWGVVKHNGKVQTRAALEADRANELLLREAERRQRDAITSIDAVDHRWITGIDSTGWGGKTARRTISDRDLL
jgi:hypothetical protein